MAASAIDEAVRNCVSVGANPRRIAILDNFCWGYTDRPETLGSLVRAALACHDVAVALGTPFISGKDSLNNEFSFEVEPGQRRTIAIPPSLLISALGQIDDVRKCVTMDLKEPGNLLYQVGLTRNELGGSHFAQIHQLAGGQVPRVDSAGARRVFETLHEAIGQGWVRSCHDLSEGGLAVALAEMAFAGGFGLEVDVAQAAHDLASLSHVEFFAALLFAESNSRFVCEVTTDHQAAWETLLRARGVSYGLLGHVRDSQELTLLGSVDDATPRVLASLPLSQLKEAWQAPLRWR
jgi:phosphoribosylformylglycinamidine synthase